MLAVDTDAPTSFFFIVLYVSQLEWSARRMAIAWFVGSDCTAIRHDSDDATRTSYLHKLLQQSANDRHSHTGDGVAEFME